MGQPAEKETVVDDVSEDDAASKKFTQQEVDAIVSKRVNKLKGKQEESSDEVERLRKELAERDQKLKLHELSQQQKSQKPNPESFEYGEDDPEYKKAIDSFNEKRIADKASEIARKEIAESQQQAELQRLREAQSARQKEHYQKALSLEVDDYVDTEDQAITVLGDEAVKAIIHDFDDAHAILYHLGKNTDKATKIAQLLKTQPVKAVAEIARIDTSVNTSNEPAPTPEDSPEGASASNVESWQRKVDKKREDVRKGKATPRDVLDLKKEALAAGVNIL